MRDRVVSSMTGVELRALLLGIRDSLERIERANENAATDIAYMRRRLAAQTRLLRDQRDHVDELMQGLETVRETEEYERAYSEAEPLVTVRIASYQRTRELMEIALPSILAQTYSRLEVVIVNDGPNPATRDALGKLADRRVRYEEFPARHQYPGDPHARWMVAGSPGMNRAAELATGSWIAPLDEDDSFTPDHVQKLVALALDSRAELAYGALMQRNAVNSTEALIWSDPPSVSQFSFQAAIYNTALGSVFSYDTESWLVDEPGDWNLIRRMTAAGVTMASTTDVVAVVNHVPYTHKVEA
jgi:hypothetical protein